MGSSKQDQHGSIITKSTWIHENMINIENSNPCFFFSMRKLIGWFNPLVEPLACNLGWLISDLSSIIFNFIFQNIIRSETQAEGGGVTAASA